MELPSKAAIMCVQTLRNVDITRISHGHISVLLEDTVTVGHAGSPTGIAHAKVTLTDPRSRSRCRKLHFSRSISSAISACCSKLMVDHDSMGLTLQLDGARFSNFLLRKL